MNITSDKLKVSEELIQTNRKGHKRTSSLVPFMYDPYGIRTRVTAVKGRCLNRLTKGPCYCLVISASAHLSLGPQDVGHASVSA